jgi:hypothetical protein
MPPVGLERPQTYVLRWVHTCNVTAYRDSVDGKCDRVNVTGLFGMLSVFGRHIKGMDDTVTA